MTSLSLSLVCHNSPKETKVHQSVPWVAEVYPLRFFRGKVGKVLRNLILGLIPHHPETSVVVYTCEKGLKVIQVCWIIHLLHRILRQRTLPRYSAIHCITGCFCVGYHSKMKSTSQQLVLAILFPKLPSSIEVVKILLCTWLMPRVVPPSPTPTEVTTMSKGTC